MHSTRMCVVPLLLHLGALTSALASDDLALKNGRVLEDASLVGVSGQLLQIKHSQMTPKEFAYYEFTPQAQALLRPIMKEKYLWLLQTVDPLHAPAPDNLSRAEKQLWWQRGREQWEKEQREKQQLAQLAKTPKSETNAVVFESGKIKAKGEAFKGHTLVFKGLYLGMPVADAQALINFYMGYGQTSGTPIEDNSSMSAARESVDPEKAFSAAMLQALGSELQGATPGQLRAHGINDDIIASIGVIDPNAPYRVYSRNNMTFVARGLQDKPFAVTDSTGSVVRFQLSREVLNRLFDAAAMPTDEFLQSFVEAYDLPSLQPVREKVMATVMGTTKEIGLQHIYRHRSPKGYEVIYYAKTVIIEDDTCLSGHNVNSINWLGESVC